MLRLPDVVYLHFRHQQNDPHDQDSLHHCRAAFHYFVTTQLFLKHRNDCQLQSQLLAHQYVVRVRRVRRRLAGAALEGLSEEEQLDLIVDGEHTSTCDTTEDIGTGTLEEGSDTFSSEDLARSIHGTIVLDGL